MSDLISRQAAIDALVERPTVWKTDGEMRRIGMSKYVNVIDNSPSAIEKEYSIIEAAKVLGIKARTVREWIRNGKVKAEKTSSGKWMIMESEIEKIIENKCNKSKKKVDK